jgi:hypothetical protein
MPQSVVVDVTEACIAAVSHLRCLLHRLLLLMDLIAFTLTPTGQFCAGGQT